MREVIREERQHTLDIARLEVRLHLETQRARLVRDGLLVRRGGGQFRGRSGSGLLGRRADGGRFLHHGRRDGSGCFRGLRGGFIRRLRGRFERRLRRDSGGFRRFLLDVRVEEENKRNRARDREDARNKENGPPPEFALGRLEDVKDHAGELSANEVAQAERYDENQPLC